MTAPEVPLTSLKHADAVEPSQFAASACLRPRTEADMTIEQKRIRRLLGKGFDPVKGSRILAERFAAAERKKAKAA